MPPRRRRNPPPDHPSPRPASPSPSPDRDGSHLEEDSEISAAEHPTPPFYNTTFSAHRVSPLYLGSKEESLRTDRLQLLSQRLRDRLVGDVVRGVEVGDGEDGVIGKAGALEAVEMRWVGVAELLGISGGVLETLEAGQEGMWQGLLGKKALHISLRYEMASCSGFMLPPLMPAGEEGEVARDATKTRFMVDGGDNDMDWERAVNPSHFLALPLLLLRMPAPLKTVVGEFLSETFDCRVSPMRLGTRSLVRSWEAWIRSAGLPCRGPLVKDVVLSLGFHLPSDAVPVPNPPQDEEVTAEDHQQPLGLKTIDVIIPATELQKFVAAGTRLVNTQSKLTGSAAGWGWENDLKQRRQLAGRLGEEGWEWHAASPDDSASQPFTEALARYLKEHLGLNLFHPGVRVVKIACGGFAMSEMRLKLFAPAGEAEAGAEGEGLSLLGQRGAVLELLGGLVAKARVQ